ncbi:hypothetical protein SAMN04487897_1552 [Paenibacillus sp. yr247]|uniref:hypothetical protein n=1 Tax=Paenibacillus sp. yr247 TaxID=1761880 RepID=UPI0008862C01|nr:hypothetical protein [Paenibacillus sp. yr247]SDP24499.1 hypothetical protein SAMN04487897_1552 [Paenibacillus sp. yr247]
MLIQEAIEAIKKIDREIDTIDDLYALEVFHKEYFIPKLVPLPERPERLLGQNGLHFLQMSLHRSWYLFSGVIDSINNNNELVFAVTTRAHFEITGAVALFLRKLKSFYGGEIAYEELETLLRRLNLGMRAKGEITHAPDPINVMTMIDAADKEYKKVTGDKTPIFRSVYDELSEFCHPNSLGLQMAGKVNKVGVVRYKSIDEPIRVSNFFLSNFLITGTAFTYFYRNSRSLLEEHEDLPIIVK